MERKLLRPGGNTWLCEIAYLGPEELTCKIKEGTAKQLLESDDETRLLYEETGLYQGV